MVSAVPPIPHAFRGDAKYTNGQNIPDGYIVTARLDNQPISTSSVIKDGKYGYDDPLLVSDIIGDGNKVYFYINGKSVENEPVNFIIGDVTNLDLTVKSPPSDFDGCGDGTCDDGETCSNCPVDCGSCSYNDNGDSPGGGSSPKSVTSKDGQIVITAVDDSDEGNETIDLSSSETQETIGPGITGGVIGFVKSGVGIGFIFAILLLIVGIGIVTFRKRKQPQSPNKEFSSDSSDKEVED